MIKLSEIIPKISPYFAKNLKIILKLTMCCNNLVGFIRSSKKKYIIYTI